MNFRMHANCVVVLVFPIAIFFFGCASHLKGRHADSEGYRAGQKAARISIEDGKLFFIDVTGIRRSWTNEERKSLQMEYGIEYKDGRGLSPEFVEGYNHGMSIEATKRFGDDYRARLAFKAHPELGSPRTAPE